MLKVHSNTHTQHIQQQDRELKKMAAMRAHNIGFYKPSHWHVSCQVILLLLVRFQFVRCPFQTEHPHLDTKKEQGETVKRLCEEGMRSFFHTSSPLAGLPSWFLTWLLASFFWFSLRTFWLVTPGMTGRCTGGVWARGELRWSSRNLRS